MKIGEQLDNIFFKVLEIEKLININPEEHVKALYRHNGYIINNSSSVLKKESPGAPTHHILKEIEDYFVYIKLGNSGLNAAQVKWIMNNPDEKVLVFYLVQKMKYSELKKIKKKENKEQKDFDEKRDLAKQAMEIM